MKKKTPNNKAMLTPVWKTKNKHSWNFSILKKEKRTPKTPSPTQFQFGNIDTVKEIILIKGGCKPEKKICIRSVKSLKNELNH